MRSLPPAPVTPTAGCTPLPWPLPLGSEPHRPRRPIVLSLAALTALPFSRSELAQAAPISMTQALADQAAGGFGDLDAAEILLEFAPLTQPPYGLAGFGLAIGVLCGLTFSRLVSLRLDGWKQDRLALLPLARPETVLPWLGTILGVTLFIGGSLQVFGFGAGAALLVAFVLSIATAGALWVQLEQLMAQVQAGTFSAVDFDNFDQFF